MKGIIQEVVGCAMTCEKEWSAFKARESSEGEGYGEL